LIPLLPLLVLASAPDGGAPHPARQADLPTPPTTRLTRLGPAPKTELQRLVTLAPSLTDLVIALGAKDRLVGVSRYDDAPEVKDLPRVGGYVDPSPEAVLALKPDLVIAEPSPGNKHPVEKMAELGLPVIVVPLHSLADVIGAARALSDALDVSEEGEALAQSMESRLQQVRWRGRGQRQPRVLMIFGWDPLVVSGPNSFAGELLTDAGGLNVVETSTNPFMNYDVERAISKKPDVILDAADVGGPNRDRFLALPGFKTARVVKLGASALRPGPRLIEALEEIFHALHPADGGL
jgi:iron complex transport system substrate-binding protein